MSEDVVLLPVLATEIGVKERTVEKRVAEMGLPTVALVSGGVGLSPADADQVRRFYAKYGYSPAHRRAARESVEALAKGNAAWLKEGETNDRCRED